MHAGFHYTGDRGFEAISLRPLEP